MRKACFHVVLSLVSILASASPFASAQSSHDSTVPLREVRGQTIVSPELPKAELTFGKEFRYAGGQQVNLYGMAEAEQHLFVRAGGNGVVEAFYWVQFEHRLPADQHRYDYPADRTTEIGGLNFIYDVKSWPEYASDLVEDPASDGAAVSRLAAKAHLVFPKRAVRVRMFHLPTPDRRTELMIIYGEAVTENSAIPVRQGGVELDKEAPGAAQALLENAKRGMSIRKE